MHLKENLWNVMKSLALFACMALLFLTMEYFYTAKYEQTLIQIEYGSGNDGVGQIFWGVEANEYQENDSARFTIYPTSNYYAVYAPGLRTLESMRFDPVNFKHNVIIKSIVFKESTETPQRFDSPELLSQLLHPLKSSTLIEKTNNGVRVIALTDDPELQIELHQLVTKTYFTHQRLGILGLALFFCLTGFFATKVFATYYCSSKDNRWRLDTTLSVIEIVLSCAVVAMIVFYLGNWVVVMATSSLWTDEIYTIEHFSSQGPLVALTDYHVANNHVFFNFINSLLPDSGSYQPLRARIVSIIAVLSCVPLTIWFFFRRKWYFAACLVLVALTNSWTHLVLMLEARGYGVIVLCALLLVYSIYSYLSGKKKYTLWGAVVAGVVGTWTVPTFGFFALPLLGLVVIPKRNVFTVISVGVGYLIIVLAYAPLLSSMLKINANYTGRWGAEYGSFSAVVTTIKNYLLPDANMVVIVILLFTVVVAAVVPWNRFRQGKKIFAWQFIAISIVLFFTICLLLKTPAVRTTAFIVLPIAVLISSMLYSLFNLYQLRLLKTVLIVVLTVIFYQNYLEKRVVLDRYYIPHENWKQTAEFIGQVFPPEKVIIHNNFRTNLLQKYLPKNYEFANKLDKGKFILGEMVVIESHPWKKKTFVGTVSSEQLLSIKIPQTRGDFQLITFITPLRSKNQGNLKFVEHESCSAGSSNIFSSFNRCLNFIDHQTMELDLRSSGAIYSVNIEGKGITTGEIASVKVEKDGLTEQLAIKDIKTTYREGRQWKRRPKYFDSLLTIQLGEKTFDRLQITFNPKPPDRSYELTSIWYQ